MSSDNRNESAKRYTRWYDSSALLRKLALSPFSHSRLQETNDKAI